MINLRELVNASCPSGLPVELEREFAFRAAGARVHVIGAGPSANEFDESTLTDADWVIVLNGALITHAHVADVWLLMESTLPIVAPWFVQDEGIFDGVQVVLDASCAGHLEASPSRITAYSDDWWRDVIWCHRWPHGKHGCTSFRDAKRGLYFRTSVDEPEGTVALQAIHLAGIMGASEVHLWGTELMSAPDGEQHCYGDKPYRDGGQVTSLIHFTSNGGEPVVTDDGPLASTPFFIRSADAIKELAIDGQDELEITNHSGGLLDWDSAQLHKLAQMVTPKWAK